MRSSNLFERRSWRHAASLAVLIMAAPAGCKLWSERPVDSAPVVVKLAAFNDFHGHINPPKSPTRIPDANAPGKTIDLPTGGVQYLSGLIAQLKTQNELNVVVAAGDLIGGSPLVSALFHHEPSIEALNQLGLEFSSVGNHEFDAGRAELLRMQHGGCFAGASTDTCRNGGFAGAQFKYLAANVIDQQTGKPMLPAYAVKKFELRGGGEIQIAFIGLVLRDTPSVVVPAAVKGLTFTDEADAANALVPELRAAGIETIVVLIHEGGHTTAVLFDDDTCPGFSGSIVQIMDRLDPAIDLVISGHTHRAYICRRAGRLVTSAGAEGRFVTDIDLTIDPRTKDVSGTAARQLAVVNDTAVNPLPQIYPTVASDSRLSSLVNLYNAAAAPLAQREIGRITKDITRQATPAGESALGDLIADAQLAATRAPELGNARIAFMNMGGIRADLRAGAGGISYGDAFAVHPFGNGLITLSLSGAQIDALLEQQWAQAHTILQVSNGFTYEWNSTAAAGQRVDIASIRLNGVAIDPAATYRVTVNEFLAQGGDGFSVLLSGTGQTRSGVDLQALEKYLGDNSPVAPPSGNRIRVHDGHHQSVGVK